MTRTRTRVAATRRRPPSSPRLGSRTLTTTPPQSVLIGQASSTGTAGSLTPIVPIQLLLHTFSGGNTSSVPAGEVGPLGVELNGDWQVLSGKLRAPGSAEAYYGWDIGVTEYTFDVVISNSSVDPCAVVRLVNTSNAILGVTIIGGGAASGVIYQRVAGGYSPIDGAGGVSWTQGDICRLVVTDDDVTMYRIPAATGIPVKVAGPTVTPFATATGVGMRTNGGAVDFDSVHAYGLVPPVPRPGNAPSFHKGKSNQSQGQNVTHTIKVPLVPVGSYLVAWANGDNTTPPTSSAGSTWTLIADTGDTGSDTGRLVAFARFATYADLYSTLSWPSANSDWGDVGIFAFTNVDTTTPLDVTPVTNTGSTTGPTITTVTDHALLVHLSAAVDATAGAAIDLTPSSLVNNAAAAEVAQSHIGFLGGSEFKETAGTSTARTFTGSRGIAKNIVLALRPAAVAAASGMSVVASIGDAGGGASSVFTLPVGIQAGDLMVVSHRSWFPVSLHSGWTLVDSGQTDHDMTQAKFVTTEVANDTVSFSVGGDQIHSGVMTIIRGAAALPVQAVKGDLALGVTTPAATPPNIVLWHAAVWDAGGSLVVGRGTQLAQGNASAAGHTAYFVSSWEPNGSGPLPASVNFLTYLVGVVIAAA